MLTTTLWLAATLLVLGTLALVWGNHIAWKMRTVSAGPARRVRRLILLGRSFRFFVVGLGLVGVALGWLHDLDWLITLSIVFGLEELYEGTAIVGALRRAERSELRAAAGATRGAPDRHLSRLPFLGGVRGGGVGAGAGVASDLLSSTRSSVPASVS
jgi:hypothetical protein